MLHRLKRFAPHNRILLIISAVLGLLCLASSVPVMREAYHFRASDQLMGANLFLVAAGICLLAFAYKTIFQRDNTLNFFIASQLSVLLFLVSSQLQMLEIIVPAQATLATLSTVYIQRTRRRKFVRQEQSSVVDMETI